MKTETERSSHQHTHTAVNKTRRFIEGAILLVIALRITKSFEEILSIQVDPHSVLHYVIFIAFHGSISFLYHRFKQM